MNRAQPCQQQQLIHFNMDSASTEREDTSTINILNKSDAEYDTECDANFLRLLEEALLVTYSLVAENFESMKRTPRTYRE